MSLHSEDYQAGAAKVVTFLGTKPGLLVVGLVVGMVIGRLAG